MSAFVSSTPLFLSHTLHYATSSRPIYTPNARLPRIAPETPLKERSLLAFRGLSDLSSAAVLHELSVRLVLGASIPTSGAADSQLLLGGLIGIWTAAAFADRLRANTASLIAETRSLPSRWDSAIIHRSAIEEDDTIAAVTWLAALDEMEGPEAASLLRTLAVADPPVRVRLANALSQFPARSNVAISVLHQLSEDCVPDVRRAAEDALCQYQESGVLLANRYTPPDLQVDMAAVLDRLFDDTLVSAHAIAAPCNAKRWVMDAVAERVEFLSTVAMTAPNLPQLGPVGGNVSPQKPIKMDVPLLEGLRRVEVHGLCTLALVPAAYELMSVGGGVDLPLRFVGLGWLLTFGGLVAYPQSGSLWRKFAKTMDEFVQIGK